MRERLRSALGKLSALYPQLSPDVRYSDVLSQGDVNVFVAFVTGRVSQVLKSCPLDVEAKNSYFSALAGGSTGISQISERDVSYVALLLSAASGNDSGISPEMRDVVDFLRGNRSAWWSLSNAYERIVKSNVIGTCPLVVAPLPWWARFVPFAGRYHEFQEFHKLFHESVHYSLENSGVVFDDAGLNESLVALFHEDVFGVFARLHYRGEGKKYLAPSFRWRKFLSSCPRPAVIPLLQTLGRDFILPE